MSILIDTTPYGISMLTHTVTTIIGMSTPRTPASCTPIGTSTSLSCTRIRTGPIFITGIRTDPWTRHAGSPPVVLLADSLLDWSCNSEDGKEASMPRSRLVLCFAYVVIAIVALIATWSQNVAYLRPEEGPLTGFVQATMRFWPDTLATPASVSITVDIGLLTLAASVFLILEARRLAMRLPWLYVVLGLLVAISVTFPLFLIARERRLAVRGEAPAALGLTRGDRVGFALLGGASAIFSLWTVLR
jgi:hypothetical protein